MLRRDSGRRILPKSADAHRATLVRSTVRIANALNATTDQLLAHEFSHPEEIYLKEIAERIEKYPVSKRILACEGFNTYLDSLEKFSKS